MQRSSRDCASDKETATEKGLVVTETANSNISVFPQHLSILPISDGRVLSLDQVTVGILTALPKEYAAVCGVLGCNQEVIAARNGSDKVYRLGVVREQAGQRGIVVAVALLIDMGNVTAAARTTNMVNDCPNLKEIIVCGIAGAVPSPTNPNDHVRVGDIVVSAEGVLQYDFGKQVPNGFQIKEGIHRPSPHFLHTARTLQADESSGKRPWEKYIDLGLGILGEEFTRPAVTTDILREREWNSLRRLLSNVLGCVQEWFGKKPSYPPIPHPDDSFRKLNPERPRVFHGLIASASRVLKDQKLREHLRRDHNAKAVEMETAGAAHAAYTGNVGYFVVRGTCDYCNLYKNDVWHFYAALVAAAYTRALLEATNFQVFASKQKVLVVVEPVTTTVEPHDEPHLALPLENVEQTLSEARKINTIASELQPGDVAQAHSQTSEAVREIPRIGDQIAENYPRRVPSDIHASLSPESFNQASIRYSTAAPIPSAKLETNTPEQHMESVPVSQLTEREQQLLASEGERQLVGLKEALEKWEYDIVFAAESVMADWIEKNEAHIAPALASQIYEMLARVETVKARHKQERGEKLDVTKARYYLGKAKDVRTR